MATYGYKKNPVFIWKYETRQKQLQLIESFPSNQILKSIFIGSKVDKS